MYKPRKVHHKTSIAKIPPCKFIPYESIKPRRGLKAHRSGNKHLEKELEGAVPGIQSDSK